MASHEIVFSTFTGGNFIDLHPFQYGRELCEPGHAFGPAQRRHYLFHYIIKGKGTLIATEGAGEQSRYELHAGEGFLIFPGHVNTYFADIEDPWEYIWVEFDGLQVSEALKKVSLSPSSPIYRSSSPELRSKMEAEMRHLVDERDETPLHLVGHAYLFFDYLLRSIEVGTSTPSKLQDFYISEAISFIEHNYERDISVEDIAQQTGLNRSYIGKVFKNATELSPQQYLIGYRMTKAAELLKLTALSIGDVAKSVGYPDQLHFSRAFKKEYGLSPRAWRRENAGS